MASRYEELGSKRLENVARSQRSDSLMSKSFGIGGQSCAIWGEGLIELRASD